MKRFQHFHVILPLIITSSTLLIDETKSFAILQNTPPFSPNYISNDARCACYQCNALSSSITPTSLSKETETKSTRLYDSSTNFLKQVEQTIKNVHASNKKNSLNYNNDTLIQCILPHRREPIGISKNLSKRILSLRKNNDCEYCWLQRTHCICTKTPPPHNIESLITDNRLPIRRLFLVVHHKEIGMVVDTAKLLLMAMPHRARLVVNGIGKEYQESMNELMDALKGQNKNDTQKQKPQCIVLFPTENSRTFEKLVQESNGNTLMFENYKQSLSKLGSDSSVFRICDADEGYDVVVIDGTWQQAQKIHQRYIPAEEDGGPPRVCLSQESLDILSNAASLVATTSKNQTGECNNSDSNGLQLRRHPIKWKEVSTLEATRLLFRDMMMVMEPTKEEDDELVHDENKKNEKNTQCYHVLAKYQEISNIAAKKQLGPPREKQNKQK